VYDILTTGNSISEVVAAVTQQGGIIVGIGVLVDRSDQKLEFGVPLFSCHRAITPTYSPSDCPLCAARVPLVKPGSSQSPSN
jgi:orotate phosphoribosyltransferase